MEKADDEPCERGVHDQHTEPQMNLRQLQPHSAAHDETGGESEQNHVEDCVLDAESGSEAECPAEHIDGREEEGQQGKEVAH